MSSRAVSNIAWSCTTRVSRLVTAAPFWEPYLYRDMQAMRYPLNAHRKELAAAEGAREREKELAKELQEGGDLDDEGPDIGEGF